jgi:phosphoglycerate kinase
MSGKTAILRIDSDVDVKDGQVTDATRLEASIETLKFLLKKDLNVNIIGHLGRPKGIDPKFTMKPVAKWFGERLGGKIESISIGKLEGWKIIEKVNLFENLRFFAEEEKNIKEFSKELSLLGDIYVNDAFAVSHRAHASIVGVSQIIPSYAGFHLQKEISVLSGVMDNPKRPLAVLIGGAKIETKLPVVEKMHKIADYVLVGGELADEQRVLIKVQHEKISGHKSAIIVAENTHNGEDIDQKSLENFCQILGMAATIIWNGPVGLIGAGEETEAGTKALAEYITSTNAFKVIGGGDSLTYLNRIGLLDKFDFVSMGGGAMLEFLSGKKLPGIAVLEE